NQHAVIVAQIFERRALELQVVLSSLVKKWEKGVMVADVRTLGPQQLNDRERRGLTKIIDILLIGDAENQHARTVYRLVSVVHTGGHSLQDMTRHGAVDLAGEFDESHLKVPLLRLPGKVERIDRDAMSAEPGAGIKRLKAKGFGCGRIDH